MSVLKAFIAEVNVRNVRKTMTIYISTALTTIGIVRLFTDVYGLPAWLFPMAVTLLTCGLASAFVFAWYHGSPGSQRVRAKEGILHALIFVVAVGVSLAVARSPRSPLPARVGKSIAVLPFKNMSASPQDDYFTDGIMEDILTQLSKIGELRVIARSSVMKYRGQETLDVHAIGEELGVAALLEGSVRREDKRVRIRGVLINTADGEQLWSEQYDRELRDVFAIQTDVAQRIAAALKTQLSPEETERIEKRPTGSLEAYGFFLRGRDYYNRYTKEDNERAIAMFKQAISLDPHYALAYAGLADAYSQRVQRFDFPQTWADSSLALSHRAIELDPDIAEPYKALGLAYAQRGAYTKAMAEYQKALRINPNFASVAYNIAFTYSAWGRYDDAMPLYVKAIQLTPGRATYYVGLGEAYLGAASDSLAEQYFRRALQLDPEQPDAYANLIQLRFLNGRYEEAFALADSAVARIPDAVYLLAMAAEARLFAQEYGAAEPHFERWRALVGEQGAPFTQLGFLALRRGNTARGNALLEKAISLASQQLKEWGKESGPAYDLCRAYVATGNRQRAVNALHEVLARGLAWWRWIENDPVLASLRQMPEAASLLAAMRTRVEHLRARAAVSPEHPRLEVSP
ncbi:MAG: hypothetical protein C4326_04175 [Ignavibacteria bacterium]